MNNLEVLGQVKTIPSYEVAEMMGKAHWEVLRMLEGYVPPEGSKSRKVIGIIPTLNDHNVVVVNYFMEFTYIDAKGESRKYYECTKMGCDMLANKMTGEKGILFTAKYVAKFEEMRQQLQQVDSYMIADPIERAKAWIREEEERKMLALTVEQQKPKVEYHDAVLNSDKLVTTTDIAKDLGMSARSLNLKLNELGIIFKQGKSWKLYAKHQNKVPEYCDYHINEFGQTLKWTEKGRKFIIDTLNEM